MPKKWPKKWMVWCKADGHISPLQRVLKEAACRCVADIDIHVGDRPKAFCDIAVLDSAVSDAEAMIRRLRHANARCKVMVLIPFGDWQRAAEYIAVGADDVLEKPVSAQRLSISLRNLLRIIELEVMVASTSDLANS